MNIALPILLLVFGGLSFWLLTESKVRWHLKISCIVTFCVFTVIFWSTIHSYLGWPAKEGDMPEKVLVHWVVIKEPNEQTNFDGAIYFLLESINEEENSFLEFFSYKSDRPEPRLFGLPYSRELHEKIEKEMRSKLQRGQPIAGKFKKGEGQNKSKSGQGKQDGKDGDGSESQRQEWQFHHLLPSEIHHKPDR